MTAITIQPSPNLAEWDIALTATEKQLKTAALRALNKTARWTRTQVASRTAKMLKIKVGLVREGVALVKARPSVLESTVGLRKRAGIINAAKLGDVKQTGAGVSVGRHRFKGAFPATMKSGHFGVFRRKRKTRLPIIEIQMVVSGKMREVMDDLSVGESQKQFATIFDRELRFLLRAA